MTDTFEFIDLTLNNPLTEEQWDMIADVDFDHTNRITFYTKHGKEVEFVKVIRCKDCKYSVDEYDDGECYCDYKKYLRYIKEWDHYCSRAERKTENGTG